MRPLAVGERAREPARGRGPARGLDIAVALSIALAIGLVAAVAACGGRADRPAPVPTDSERGRFPHQKHRAIACTGCHRLADVLAGRPARPGVEDHAPCDRERCHRAEFLATPGPLCRVCHRRVALGPAAAAAAAGAREGEKATLPAPYPPVTGRRALATEFSHAGHLDAARMESRVGFHVACSDCHELAGDELRPADHAVCARCHAPEASLRGMPTMAQCTRCHVDRPLQPSRLRHFIVGDLHFDHGHHRQDHRGRLIACATCHADSAGSARTGVHAPPAMSACVECHDDSARTPPARQMRVCEGCHDTKRASFGGIAPRSHLPALERPEDHTRAFRRDHAADASADPQRCARCHTFMSGSPRDACDDCHRTMRPQDHTVTWREYDHGPASAARADGCATCHQGDYCIACHSQRPRSHFPQISFGAGGGHGQFARVNLRSCAACHDFQRDCATSGCHAPGEQTAR
ncbi:MAG TPA: cytochrome c3 family protein [Kofleriaceae bacterium]|nr:cytochrome c3 family protein [Kofleriaceae bacterium]